MNCKCSGLQQKADVKRSKWTMDTDSSSDDDDKKDQKSDSSLSEDDADDDNEDNDDGDGDDSDGSDDSDSDRNPFAKGSDSDDGIHLTHYCILCPFSGPFCCFIEFVGISLVH